MTTSVDPHGVDPAPRRGLWARVRAWFSGRRSGTTPAPAPAPVPVSVPLPVSECRTLDEPIRVPADGGVFEFVVHVEVVYSARGLAAATLTQRVESYVSSDKLTVQRTIWPVGRRFLPHHAEAVENAMNEELRAGWCHEGEGEVVSCQPSVRVTADERVLAGQRPQWERLIDLDLRMRVERRRIDVVDDLVARWRNLIKKFDDEDGFVAMHAARLVDVEYADVVRRLTDERKLAARDLALVLRDASNAHAHLGLYEFTTAYDTALRGMQHMLGISAPSLVGDASPAGGPEARERDR